MIRPKLQATHLADKLLVKIHYSIDKPSLNLLSKAIRQAKTVPSRVVIDCSNAERIEPEAIEALLDLHLALNKEGSLLRVAKLSDILAHHFEDERLDSIFTLFDNVEQALEMNTTEERNSSIPPAPPAIREVFPFSEPKVLSL